jgi:hypothetical protein
MTKAPRMSQNALEPWEVETIKAMLARGGFSNQKIVAYFSRPTRSINQARIVDVKKGRIFSSLMPAGDQRLDDFLDHWPDIDPQTGLHVLGDELLLKAREAMLLAVQSYNSPKTYFRSEVFIVISMIAWTYLLHAYYKSKNVDYRHHVTKDGKKTAALTQHGAPRYWELEQCIKHNGCPLDTATKNNLLFLIQIRHEIEHRLTHRIDDALSAKLQACCLNFNRVLRQLFGEHLALHRDLSVALQFVSFSLDQQKAMFKDQSLPPNVATAQTKFEAHLTDQEFNDPNYAFRVALVQRAVSNKGKADQVVQIVPAGSEDEAKINRVLLKEVERKKFKPKQVVEAMKAQGFGSFTMDAHSKLWKTLTARDPAKQYGVTLSDGQWYWYETWIARVREYCLEKWPKPLGELPP